MRVILMILSVFCCTDYALGAWKLANNQVKKQFVAGAMSVFLLMTNPVMIAADDTASPPATPNKGYQTKSGVKFFDFALGAEDTPSPRYGQLISFYYNGYYRPLPEGKIYIRSHVLTHLPAC